MLHRIQDCTQADLERILNSEFATQEYKDQADHELIKRKYYWDRATDRVVRVHLN